MFHVERLSKEEWMKYARECHTDLFGDEGWNESQRIAFVVALKDKEGVINHYIQVDEVDAEFAYLTYGGSLSKWRNLGRGPEGFIMMLNEIKRSYKRVGFWTKFKNGPMIKLGLKVGFEIMGTRMVHGVPGVEMFMEF